MIENWQNENVSIDHKIATNRNNYDELWKWLNSAVRTAQKAETTKYNFAKLYEMKLSKAETLIYLEVSNLTNKAIECWTHAQHPKNLNQFKLSIEIRSNFVIVNRLTHIMWEYLEFNEDFPDGT